MKPKQVYAVYTEHDHEFRHQFSIMATSVKGVLKKLHSYERDVEPLVGSVIVYRYDRSASWDGWKSSLAANRDAGSTTFTIIEGK